MLRVSVGFEALLRNVNIDFCHCGRCNCAKRKKEGVTCVVEHVLVRRWWSHGCVYAVFLFIRRHGCFRINVLLVLSRHGLFAVAVDHTISHNLLVFYIFVSWRTSRRVCAVGTK